jgi:RimJ/RimL family protein N-acetyltransferase
MSSDISTQRFSCRPLSGEDWMIYRTIRLALWEDSHEVERKAEDEARGPAYWQQEATNSPYKNFVLFDGSHPIGMTMISFSESLVPSACEFTGSHILKSYQGRKLGDLLHQARKDYLRATNGPAKILTEIWPAAARSRAVVERNGFTKFATIQDENGDHDIYVCHL